MASKPSNATYQLLVLVGVFFTAHAVYWFIGGRSDGASDLRTAAVAAQIIAGLILAAWAWRRSRQHA